MIRWKVFRARPDWSVCPPGRPWTVLRPIPDDGDGCVLASHSNWPTWQEAYGAANHAAAIERSEET